MQLGGRQGAVFVNRFRDPAVTEKSFPAVQGQKWAFQYRNIPDDDHGCSAPGDGAQFFQVLLFLKAHGGRGEDNSVFQGYITQLEWAVNRLIHGSVPLYRLPECRRAGAIPKAVLSARRSSSGRRSHPSHEAEYEVP